MSFESPLIDSTAFQKYKLLRYTLYTICMLSFIILLMILAYMDDRGMGLDALKWVLLGVVILAVITTLVLGLTVTPKRQGQLCIGPEEISIAGEGFEADFDMKQVKNIKIERGATYHLAYKNDDWYYSGDNWLEFSYQGQRYIYEFEIESEEKNDEFEHLLRDLRRHRIPVKFTSI